MAYQFAGKVQPVERIGVRGPLLLLLPSVSKPLNAGLCFRAAWIPNDHGLVEKDRGQNDDAVVHHKNRAQCGCVYVGEEDMSDADMINLSGPFPGNP